MKLTIAFFIIAALNAAELSGIKEIQSHFWNKMTPATSSYSEETFINKNTGIETHMFKLTSGKKEHMLDISVSKSEKGVLLRFSRHKKENIEKMIQKYNDNQIEIQSKVFSELIRRLVSVDDPSNNILYFNMIEDIKDAILGLGKNKKLRFEESFVDETVRLELYYLNDLLALFEIQSVKKVVESEDKFFLVVKFTVSNLGKESTSFTEIEVLTYDESHFNTQMNVITSKLDLNNYVNCGENSIEQLHKFGNDNFGSLISFIPLPVESSDKLKKFNIKSNDDTAYGAITYVDPPKNSDQVGGYRFTLKLNGFNVVDVPFKRMSNSDFQKFIENLKIPSFFFTLYDKIKSVFEEKVKQVTGTTEKDLTFTEKHKTGLFVNTVKRDFAVLRNEHLVVLSFEEKSDLALVKLESELPFLKELGLTFVRKSYNPEVLAQYIVNSLNTIIEAKGKKSSSGSDLNSSQKKSFF